jgi:predicted ATPase
MDSRSPPVPAQVAPAPGLAWQLRLLGALEATQGARHLARFPSRAVAVLLARLALQPDRAHPRESLVELLWPGVELDVGRNRLRQVLSTLKSLLEGDGAAPVLQADRLSIRVLPGRLDCDARQFEQALRRGDAARAHELYRGELMPGHYDDWVQDERRRLAALHERLAAQVPAAAPVPAVPAQLPPLPSGLPSYWTRSIGAEQTASRLRGLVGGQRLVTVFGPGGSGKTRLTVEVAAALREAPGLGLQDMAGAAPFDRVAFVPLVDCVNASQVLDAISTALHAQGSGPARDRITAALVGGRALLVLDNLEQLDAAAGLEIAELLRAAPGLHVLGTSRRLLDLDGEHAFELDGLPLPPAEAALQEALANPSVQLFADRARAARADFQLEAGQLPAVVGLVRLLGGMPLAIELAASRVRSLAPADLLQRLREDAGTPMLDLLARSAQRTTPGSRHASMRHVVEWSWRQLRPEQAALLGAMSVLASAARADLAAAVGGLEARAAQILLDELVDACLVRAAAGAQGAPRYLLQQPVREFAAETCSADEARLARQRLRQWLLAFARQPPPPDTAAVAAQVAHVHSAIVAAVADGAAHEAMRIALALRGYWESDHLPPSTVQALERGLDALEDPAERADAHELLAFGYGGAALMPQALRHAAAGVDAARAAQDDRRIALALARSVATAYFGGRFDTDSTLATLSEAAAHARRSGDPHAQATVLRLEGLALSNFLLDYAGAERKAAESLTLWKQAGVPAMERMALMNQAVMWAWMGRNEDALPVLLHCEQTGLAEGDWYGAMNAARQVGRVQVRLHHGVDAAVALRRAVHMSWQRRSARSLANSLLNLPEALLLAGQPEVAARLHAFAGAHWARLYGSINRIETAERKRARRLLRMRLGAERLEALRLQGLALELPQAVEQALDTGAA